MSLRNNITRLLDSRGIPYEAFTLPEEKLSGLKAAALLQIDPGQVFKTIVHTRPEQGKPILALVPAPDKVDRKLLARAVGEKKVNLTTQKEAEAITRLKAGGISPLALLHRPFQVVIDASVMDLAEIYTSGGKRGLNIRLPVKALIELTNATIAPIRVPRSK